MKQFKYLFLLLSFFNLGAQAQTATPTPSNSCTQTGECYTIQLLSPVINANTTVTVRFSVTNRCNTDLSYIAFQLPASAPRAISYTSTYGGIKAVENSTNNPYYSIKFELNDGFSTGSTAIFTYTLSAADYANLTSIRVQTKAGNRIETFVFNKTCTNNPLPVTLVSFTGNYANNGVNLNWSTASEKNSAFYSVERSTDGSAFVSVGQVNAAGNSTSAFRYSFTDKDVSTQVYYYRLKQVDLDGTTEYSPVVTVAVVNNAALEVTAAPNPVTGSEFTVSRSVNVGEAIIEMMNANGQTVYRDLMKSGESAKNIATGQMAPGMYFIRMISTNGSESIKVMVGSN